MDWDIVYLSLKSKGYASLFFVLYLLDELLSIEMVLNSKAKVTIQQKNKKVIKSYLSC